MANEEWEQVKEIFDAALRHKPQDRAAFLDEVCTANGAVRREVESLLSSYHRAEDFMDQPLISDLERAPPFQKKVFAKDQVFGHYKIIDQIGAGGMGEVYLAEDTTLSRPAALKLLPREHIRNEERLRRFRQEAKAASALNHPNILTIYEVGEADGHSFIATEFIDGETLRESLARTGAMKLNDALNVAVQVAGALMAAHEAGIVHRDIKPENIMVRGDGYVKVLDFGIAKLLESSALRSADISPPAAPLGVQTNEGVIFGTPQYTSPEQAAAKAVDARSDIFSFGAVLYEMVGGQPAFQDDSPAGTLAAILNQEPKPLPAKAPSALAKIILRCLRKEPARRYQSMAEVRVALEDLREEARAGRPVRRPLGWYWIGAACLLVLLFVGLLIWRPWRAPQDAEPLRAIALTTLPGIERYPSFSPDGNQVAFTWNGPKQDNTNIYVQQIGSSSPVRLTADQRSDHNPVWSRDGRWIAFLRGDPGKSELRLVSPLTGPERKVAEVRPRQVLLRPLGLAWCPNSDCLVVTDSPGEGQPDALFVVSLDGQKRQLTSPQPPSVGDTDPAVSPDGSWLVFRRNSAPLFNGELYRLPLGKGLAAAGAPHRLTLAELDADYPTWMPDSNGILFSARGSLWSLVVPGENTPARLPFVGEDGLMPVVSPAQPGRPARLAYARSFTDYNIWRVETSAPGARASAPPVVSVSSTREDSMPDLSPDGRRVAFTTTRSGEWEIWLADLDGSNAAQLTSLRGPTVGYPRWSPNSELIVFHSNPGGQWDLYVIPVTGGKPRNLTSHPALDSFPSFSRDGQWVYFSSNRTGRNQIWKVPVSGGVAVPVTNDTGFASAESPDGVYLYYVQAMDAPSALWRMSVAGEPVKVLDGVVLGNFVVRERGIYYIDRPSGEGGVYYMDRASAETRLQYFDLATRRSTTVARNLGIVDLPLTVSSDGRTIFYARQDSSVDDLMLVENFRVK